MHSFASTLNNQLRKGAWRQRSFTLSPINCFNEEETCVGACVLSSVWITFRWPPCYFGAWNRPASQSVRRKLQQERMSNPQDQFKINLNQNLWGLVVGLGGLGLAEHFRLCALFWFSVAISSIMAVSVACTTVAYTVKYCKRKWE